MPEETKLPAFFKQYIPPAFVSELLELMYDGLREKLKGQPEEVIDLFISFGDLYYSHLLQARGATQEALEEFGLVGNVLEALQLIEKNGLTFWQTPTDKFWKIKPTGYCLASRLFPGCTTNEEGE